MRMNIESKKYKIESADLIGVGFILTQKARPGVSELYLYLSTAPGAGYLAQISESRFDKEAAAAMQTGAWT